MMRKIAGLRMLVTGASSGIGHSLTEQASLRGASVAAVARSEDKLLALVTSLSARGAKAIAIPGDITSEEDRQRILNTILERWDGLDVLVNNAGISSFGHFSESTEEILRRVMEVNFFAPAELIRLFIPVLTNGRQPAVVNVSSMCGRRGVPAWSEYASSKFALCGLTEALKGELARFEIDILQVLPGLTRTNLRESMLRKDGRIRLGQDRGMSPDYVAERMLSALERNKGEIVLGWEARWMLRVNRFLPRLVDRLMARKVRQLYAVPKGA